MEEIQKVKDLTDVKNISVSDKLMVLIDSNSNTVQNITLSNLGKNLISTDNDNELAIGEDGRLYSKAQQKSMPATKTTLGEIIVGDNLDVDESGKVSAQGFIEGTGISITTESILNTNVSVTSTNENLTVTSSYTGTMEEAGTITYTFNYIDNANSYVGATLDKGSPLNSPYFILYGDLYYDDGATPVKVGNESGWSAVSVNLGICNGKLYLLNESEAKIIDNSENWSAVCGQSSETLCGYAIKNSELYAINNNTVIKISNITGWSNICGYSSLTNNNAYGICNGELYTMTGLSATKVGNLSNWTKISGVSNSSGNLYAYGINNGNLYAISNTTTTIIGSSANWTDVSGYSQYPSDGAYAFGINNSNLYTIQGTSITQIDTYVSSLTANWEKVSGYYINLANVYAIGLRDGKLHVLSNDSISQIGSADDFSQIWGSNGNFYATKNDGSLYGYNSNGYFTLLGSYQQGWDKDGVSADLTSYNLTVTGTPANGDIITLTYDTQFVKSQNRISLKGGSSDTTINILPTSGSIELTDNSVNYISPSENVTFFPPIIPVGDNSFHQILVIVDVVSSLYPPSIDVGTPYFFGNEEPDLSYPGVYDLIYQYQNKERIWLLGMVGRRSS